MSIRRAKRWANVAVCACASFWTARAFAQGAPQNFDPTGGEPTTGSAPAPTPLPGGGYWLPGQPFPIAGQNSPNNPTNETGGLRPERPPPTSGRGTGEAVVRPEDYASAGITVEDPHATDPNNTPETHLVRKGETLWEISNAYFRNPWYWPKLWAYNPAITNPHWIYPGDTLRLRPPDEQAVAGLPAAGGLPQMPASSAMRSTRDGAADAGIHLRANGFVEVGELKTSGRISASKEERMMLSYLDEVYVEYNSKAKPHPGDRLSIYRVVSHVKRPGTGQVMGSIVEIVGELEVRSIVDRKLARAVVVEARAPIERNFRVGPLKRRFDLVAPVPDRADVDALVMAALTPTSLMGEAMIVFLDRGRDDGVQVGNRLMVVRRGDGYMPRMGFRPQNDKRFPREVMGEVLVVEVRGKTSTAVVVRSIKEVEVGDQLEARKGY